MNDFAKKDKKFHDKKLNVHLMKITKEAGTKVLASQLSLDCRERRSG